ncbi:DUF2806 domain-containing protein [Marinicaulis aureus]|uniref:DUF2806 domain-containing protein n=1 Tax=Hyphococcus aureus TaxID=2666033 RepID=A0ABW1KUB1_9PROT
MADGNLPTETDKNGSFLEKFGKTLSDAMFPNIRENVDKALGRVIGASGELCATLIDNETEKLKTRKDARVVSIRSINNAANDKNLTDDDIISRAASYQAQRTLRQQLNREKICKAAAEEIGENPPTKDAADSIDDDWLEQFSRHAEKVSSEQMQRLWSKILAGEIKTPGRFNFRTMDFISKLSRQEATLISSVFPFATSGGEIMLPEELCKEKFTEFLTLEELGLISGSLSAFGGIAKSYDMKGQENEYHSIRFGDIAVVFYKKPDANDLAIPIIKFSSVMTEIMSLCDYKTDREHVRKVIDFIKGKNFRVRSGFALDRPDGMFQLIEVSI